MGNDPLRGRVRRLEATDLEGPGDNKDEAEADDGSGRCVGAEEIVGEEGGEVVKGSSRQVSSCWSTINGGRLSPCPCPCPCEEAISGMNEDKDEDGRWMKDGGWEDGALRPKGRGAQGLSTLCCSFLI